MQVPYPVVPPLPFMRQLNQGDELGQLQAVLRARQQRAAGNQLPSIERLLWLANEDRRVRRQNDFELDLELAFSHVDHMCLAILADAARAEREYGDDEEADHHEAGVIRPTGRARRVRGPYTISTAVRETNWFVKSMQFDDRDFRVIYRMSKHTFWSIVALIAGNPIFLSRGRRKQRPAHQQLGVFLIRYGAMGTRSNMTSLLTSVGEGTVVNYCRRVVRAIREAGLDCVGWPDEDRKAIIKAAFKEICGLDGIIGALDGSLIDIAKRPPGSDASFISRKGTVATSIQATVDHEGRFTSFATGFPGSKPDTYVWKRSHPCRHHDAYFNEGEFLLADGGYPLSPFVVTPYSRNERVEDTKRKLEFGRIISSARVVVERTFGRLKARFPSLVMMGEVDELDDLYRAIEAMMVLHNMCYNLHDTVSISKTNMAI